jgi:hypothetical protein
VAAAARMVVVVRSVVVVAREAASVVKVAAARRRWRWMGRWWRRRMAVGGGAPIAIPLAAPNTHCGVRRGYGLTTSTQSAVLKNTGAYPEGIIGSEYSGGGQTPVT